MVTLTKSKKIPDKQCADLWVNLCCENIEPFRELKLLNQAHCGASKPVLPEAYTAFTKQEILNIESRNDHDIYALYTLAHTQYREAGGIDPGDWINLYSSFNHNKIDVNFDLVHPGKKSNLLYYDIVCKKVQNHINFSA